ncbi:MAG: hypothetical protein ACLTCP_08460 [Ruminococcus bicirculans (ex Wegman et al. 2014)]
MKKFAAGLIAVAMSVTMLAGCGVPANTVHSVDDLEGKTIGVQLGTTGDIYAEDVKDAKVEKYNKGADAVQALKQGKIDAVIIDAEPAKVFVEKNDDLEILDEPFAEEEYAIAMKLDNTELQTAINMLSRSLRLTEHLTLSRQTTLARTLARTHTSPLIMLAEIRVRL